MLTFQIKADMSVQSLTGGLKIGDGFEDIVVISEMEHALITMKMISPSGEVIPDVQFTPIVSADKTIWKAILPAGAVSSGGLLTYQFFITTASGKMYKTERGLIRVQDEINNYMPDSVIGFSNYTITQYYELLAALQTNINNAEESIKGLVGYKSAAIVKEMWGGRNEYTLDKNEAITDGVICMVMPTNASTRNIASEERMRVKLVQDPESKVYSVVLTRSEDRPAPATLFFTLVYLRKGEISQPVAILTGTDTVPEDVDESIRDIIASMDEFKETVNTDVADFKNSVSVDIAALRRSLTAFSASVGSVISNLREEITVSQTIALKSDYQTATGLIYIGVPDVDNGDVILLLPADSDTRSEIARLGLHPTINIQGLGGATVVLNADVTGSALEHDLTFVVIRFKEDESALPPKVALIGVSATPQDVRNALDELKEDIGQAKSDIVQANNAINQAKQDIEEKVTVGIVSLAAQRGATEVTIKAISTLDNGDILFLYPGTNIDYRLVRKHKISVKLNNSNQLVFSLKNPPTDIITIAFNFVRINDDTQNDPVASIVGAPYFEDTPTAIDLSRLDDGEVVETFSDGTVKTTTIEYDADGNPVKITDGDGNVTVLTW